MITKNKFSVQDYDFGKDLWTFLFEVKIPMNIISAYFETKESASKKLSVFIRIDYDDKNHISYEKKLSPELTSEKLFSFVSVQTVLPEKQSKIKITATLKIPDWDIQLFEYTDDVSEFDDFRFSETEKRESFFKKQPKIKERLNLPNFFEPNTKQEWLSEIFQASHDDYNCFYFFIDLEKYFETVYDYPKLVLDKTKEIKNSLFVSTDSKNDIITYYFGGNKLFFSVISANQSTFLSISTLDRTKELAKELFVNFSENQGPYYEKFLEPIKLDDTRERTKKNVLEQINLEFPELTTQFIFAETKPSKNISIEFEKQFVKLPKNKNVLVNMNLNPRMSFDFYKKLCEEKKIQESFKISKNKIVSAETNKFSFLQPDSTKFSKSFISNLKEYNNPFELFYDMFIQDTKNSVFETQEQLLAENGIDILELSKIVQNPQTSFEMFLGTPKQKETNIRLTENNEQNIKFANTISEINLRLQSDWIGFADVDAAFTIAKGELETNIPNSVLKVLEDNYLKTNPYFFEQNKKFRYYMLPILYLNYLFCAKVEYLDFDSTPNSPIWKKLNSTVFDENSVVLCRLKKYEDKFKIPKFKFEKEFILENEYFILTKSIPTAEQTKIERKVDSEKFFDKTSKNIVDKLENSLFNELKPFVDNIEKTIDKK